MHEDLCKCFQGDTLLAVQAPSGTRSTYTIPDKVSTFCNPHLPDLDWPKINKSIYENEKTKKKRNHKNVSWPWSWSGPIRGNARFRFAQQGMQYLAFSLGRASSGYCEVIKAKCWPLHFNMIFFLHMANGFGAFVIITFMMTHKTARGALDWDTRTLGLCVSI